MACETCTQVFTTKAFQPGDGPHHTELKYEDHQGGFCIWPPRGQLYFVPHKADRAELQQSAQDGCSCCAWLLTQTSPPTPEQESQQNDNVFGFWLCRTHGGVFYCVSDYRPPDGGFRNMRGKEINDIERMLLAPTGNAFELIASHGSPAAISHDVGGRPTPAPGDLSHIKAWLDDCLQNHPGHPQSRQRCRGSPDHDPDFSEERSLPTRLLDLCSWDDSAAVKLVNTSNKQGTYATLTYRWGPNPDRVFKTTKETLSQRMQGIEMAQLNPLFREAIHVCRYLNIRYLWIDALCIIQDDESDWSRESKLMCDVYSNSSLTIAADGAESAEEPLFSQIQRGNDQAALTFPYYGGGEVQLHPYRHLHEDPETSSLGLRGWCLQEQSLSRRIIHFYKSYTEWECSTTPQAEQRYMPPYMAAVWEWLRPLGRNGFQGLDDPYTTWYFLLTDYTGRRTTYPRDRLSAIAGLTQAFSRATGERFACGLWASDLLRGLLWYRSKGAILTRFSTSTAQQDGSDSMEPAPSWSWLNVLGRVHWPYLNSVNYLAEIISLDESQGTVALKTVLMALPSDLQYDDVSDAFLLDELAAALPSLRWNQARLDIPPKDETVESAVYYQCRESGEQQKRTVSFQKDVLVLVMAKPSYTDEPGSAGLCGFGLLVVATGQAANQYARVGSIRFWDRKDESGQLSDPDFWDNQEMQTVYMV